LTYEQKSRFYPKVPHKIGDTIPCETEEEIFKALELPYKAPEERNVFDIDHLFTEQEKAEEFKLIADPDENEYNTTDSDR
jgi:hypothetical protein